LRRLVFAEVLQSHLPTRSLGLSYWFFFYNHPPTTEFYTLSLHDALPIYPSLPAARTGLRNDPSCAASSCRCSCLRAHRQLEAARSEEHTSELQSRFDLVCRLLLEKKNAICLR